MGLMFSRVPTDNNFNFGLLDSVLNKSMSQCTAQAPLGSIRVLKKFVTNFSC